MKIARDNNSGNYRPENGKRYDFSLIPVAVLDDIALSAAAVLVYGALMRAQQPGDECSPDLAWIAKMTRFSKSTVHRALVELRERGWVSWTSNGGGWNQPNIYQLACSPDSADYEEAAQELYGDAE